MEHSEPDFVPVSSQAYPANWRIIFADLAVVFATLAALIAVAMILLARGGVYFSQWMQDVFIPLGGVAHIRLGQWPHRDFVTPVGSLWYVINFLPTLFMPLCARVVVWANLIVALFASLCVLVVCLGKMPRWLASVCAFYVGMVALSPRQIGEDFAHISNNASYNRYCWALICVIALASLLPVPGGTSRRRELADGAIAGLLIAMCFYIKVTYAAAGFGFIGLALATTRGLSGWRFAVCAGLIAIAVICAAGGVTGDLPGYFDDMKTAVAVLPHTARAAQALLQLGYTLPSLFFVGIFSRIANARHDQLLGSFGPGAWAGVLTLFAGLAIQVQNHPEPENPLLPVALLIGWGASRMRTHGAFRFPQLLGQLLMGSFLAFLIAVDICAVCWTAIAPEDRGPSVKWLAGMQINDLRVAAHFTGPEPDDQAILRNDAQILDFWKEAVLLLGSHLHGRQDAIVLPFTWSNPIPFLLGLRPVLHEVAWWDPDRTFNAAIKPAPRVILASVDYVLVPRHHTFHDTGEEMWAAYGTLLQREFKPVDHTPYWDLWTRKSCASRALC